MSKRIAFCVLFFCSSLLGSPNETNFSRLNSDRGVELVSDIHRDSRGYVWIATLHQGLALHNGYSLTFFRTDENDLASLPHNTVRRVLETRSGEFWVCTVQGLCRFDPATQGFERFSLVDGQSGRVVLPWLADVLEDRAQRMWVLTDRSLLKYDPETEVFEKYSIVGEGHEEGGLYGMVEDEEGIFWILSSRTGLYRFDPETGDSVYFQDGDSDAFLFGRKRIVPDPDGRYLWIAMYNRGLVRFDKRSNFFKRYPIDPEETGIGTVSDAAIDVLMLDEKTVVVGVDEGGLCYLDKETDIFSYFDEKDDGTAGLTTNSISRIYKDREGIFWVGTNRGGVFYQDPSQYQFLTYRIEGVHGARSNMVGTILEDSSGLVWMGSHGDGISTLDLKTGELSSFTKESGQLTSNAIHQFAEDRNGDVWVATWDGGVNRFIRSEGHFVHVPYPEETNRVIANRGLQSIFIDSSFRIWLGMAAKILILDQELNIIEEIGVSKASQGASDWHFRQFEDGSIHVSSYIGLFLVDESKLELKPIVQDIAVAEMARGDDGTLYIASRNQGINIYESDGTFIRTLADDVALSSLSLRSMQLGDDGALWVGTEFGLSRVDLKDGDVTRFFEEDGLQGSEFIGRSSAKLRDGRLAFGGAGGLTVWDPQKIETLPWEAPVVIEGLRVLNEPVPLESMLLPAVEGEDVRRAQFDWDSKMISFDFLAVGFTYAHKTNYAYMLEGFDEGWIYTDSQSRTATYTNLAPGKYTFRVKASQYKNVWSPHVAQLGVIIVPPFWKTIWFYTGASIVAIAFIYWIFSLREHRLNEDRRRLREQVEERTRFIDEVTAAKNKAEESDRLKSQFLANMSHEIRTPMNAILGFSNLLGTPNLKAEERQSFIEQVSYAAESLLRLIEDILDISMIEADQLRIVKEEFSLMQLLEELHSSFLIHPRGEEVQFHYENSFRRSEVWVASDRFRIRQILVNLLSNAFKFTLAGSVTLGVRNVSGGLSIFVRDTGEGMTDEEQAAVFRRFVQLDRHVDLAIRGVGLGLAISKRLSDLLGCELSLTSRKGIGTEFSLLISDAVISERGDAFQETNQAVGSFAWQGRVILVVEDEDSNFLYIKEALKGTQAEIVWAKNGRDAVDQFESGLACFDLVLMDIKMPVLDGYRALKRIKELKVDQIVIAQTAHAMSEDLIRIREAGFDDYLCKPILPEKLMETVEKYLQNQG